MNNLHNEKSNIDPNETKSLSEGAGKLLSSIGKELDEHDTIGKVGNAKAFLLTSFGMVPYIFLLSTIIIAVSVIVIFVIVGVK